jgi:predicted TIM-barrel enzyme
MYRATVGVNLLAGRSHKSAKIAASDGAGFCTVAIVIPQ